MNRIILAILTMSLLCCQPATAAQLISISSTDSHPSAKTLARELMIKSGLNKQLKNTPDQLKASVDNDLRNTDFYEQIPQYKIDQINSIISTSFNPELILSIVTAHIESELAPDDIRSVLAWLDSPLGKKLTRLEEIASTPEAYKEMMSVIPALKKAPDYDERIKLMYEIDKSVKATEMVIERKLNNFEVTITAMSSAFPEMNLPSVEQIKNNFKTNHDAIAQSISREITLTTLYTFRNVSREDIEKYIAFMKTDYGKKYHGVIHEGTSKAFAICGKKLGEAVGKALSKQTGPAIKKTSVQYYPQEL